MDMRSMVAESAIKQQCPPNKIDDVWTVVRKLEFPTTYKHIDNDVFYAMKELGLV